MYLTYLSTFVFASTLQSAQAVPHLSPRTTNSTTGRPNPTYSKEQLNDIKLALSAVDRYTLIDSFGPADDYFKFDFSIAANPEPVAGVGQGGQGDLAYVDNFPALLNAGVSMSMGFLKPCGMNTVCIWMSLTLYHH